MTIVLDRIEVVAPSIQYVRVDSSSMIKCQVSPSQLVDISWYKGNKREHIRPISKSNYEQRSTGLFIKKVSSAEKDSFICRVDNLESGESIDHSIQLLLTGEISLRRKRSHSNEVLLENVHSTRIRCVEPCAVHKRRTKLICSSQGIPEPEYFWFYDQVFHFAFVR